MKLPKPEGGFYSLSRITLTMMNDRVLFALGKPIEDVIAISVGLLSGRTSIVATSDYVTLASSQIGHSQDYNVSQTWVSTGAGYLSGNLIWFQEYPVPALSNQLPPIKFYYYQSPKSLQTIDLAIRESNGLPVTLSGPVTFIMEVIHKIPVNHF